MHPLQATVLGVVEGLTEFLPVSSTGHLILVSSWMRLQGESVKTFDIVIQAGALAAVLGLYRARIRAMLLGLIGRDRAGAALLGRLLVSFLPAAIVGLVWHQAIKERLFQPAMVAAALATGGLVMIGVAWRQQRAIGQQGRPLESITCFDALVIGAAQVLALWPGTSRSMVTIVAALLLGCAPAASAEYSFLLALPTLGAATVFDAVRGGSALWAEFGGLAMACGFAAAAIVAVLAIKGFVRYLGRHSLAGFGWYRVALATVVWWCMVLRA